jgi:hypothetical protein
MKIDKDVFLRFIELINLGGDVEIRECVLRGDPDKLTVVAQTANKVLALQGELKGDYSELGVLGVDDLSLLKKVLSKLSGEIEVSRSTNKLELSNGKKVNVELALRNTQYIFNEVDDNKFQGWVKTAEGNVFTIKKEDVLKFAEYYGVFGKDVKVEGKSDTVAFKLNNGDNSFNFSFDLVEAIKPFTVKLSSLFVSCLGVVKDEVKMSINDRAAAILMTVEKNDFKFNYVIAPMVSK